MKTVRFTQLVERCGAPVLHPLWMAPEKDAEFQRAVKAERVLTLEQVNGGARRDRGVIGYAPGDHAQFLVFPQSLKAFAGREVVGVKYEMLREPAVKEPYHAPAAKPGRRARAERQMRMVEERREPKRPADEATPPAPAARRRPKRAGRASNVVTFDGGKTVRAAADAGAVERHLAMLLAEAKRSLKELKQGKAVAAYERLTAAVRDEESA